MDGFEWAADLLQHLCHCCTRLLPSLVLLRRLQSVVGTLRACDWLVRSDGVSVLTHDA
jgi:hypothetical protein